MMFNLRRPSPISPTARPRLEVRRNPLYSNQPISNASTQVTFFRDQVGSGGQTLLDTNMIKPGALPNPRIFDIHAIACGASQALTTRSAGIPATENDPHAVAAFNNSLKTLFYSAFLEFTVGTKKYVESPIFLLPGNQKFSGSIIGAIPDTTNFATGRRDVFSAAVGLQWSTKMRRIRLQPDQPFFGTMTFPIVPVAATNGRVVYLYLLGLDYREVQ